jgi:putative endonuclease
MTPPPAYSPEASPENKKGYVYLLRSLKTGTFYLGWTTDLNRRLQEHNSGKSFYTKTRGPWELLDYETYANIEQAKERERKLKHNPRMLFLFKKRALNQDVPSGHRQVVG